MRRAVDASQATRIVQTASETVCPRCERALHISQHRRRFVYRLDGLMYSVDRDKRCPQRECPGRSRIYRPPQDIRLALPSMSYGLDVVVWVGEGHLVRGESLRQLGRELNQKKVPIDQTQVGELLRTYLVLGRLCRGDEAALRQRLLKRGGIVLMVDGVQHDDRSPVLYLCWDALSGTPLFGERKEFRGRDDLIPLLERVKAMDVPVIGIVTDKEKGLVPAVQAVFPEVPYHFCHTHFLKNCAKPMESDLSELGASVAQRAESVQKLAAQLHQQERNATKDNAAPPLSLVNSTQDPDPCTPRIQTAAAPALCAPSVQTAAAPAPETAAAVSPASSLQPSTQDAPLTEAELVKQLCAAVRVNAKASGKAPLNPPQLLRHQRLESIRATVRLARQKKRHPDPSARFPGPGLVHRLAHNPSGRSRAAPRPHPASSRPSFAP
jgi:hypothetical protein